MGKHVAALGFLYSLFGLFAGAMGVLVLMVGLGSWGQILREFLEIIGYGHLVRWLGASFGAALLASALLCLTAGFGLFARKGWGRILGIAGSVSQLATFSWPALLGAYGLWVLLSRDGAREFRRRR